MDIYERFFSKYHDEILEIGEARGIKKGREEERQSILQRLLASGMSQEEAAKIVGLVGA